ncbi:MAG: GNAT family N-acetyltransferase [Methanomicrobiales archaeon]|nr:GNAT family N-acetyltransferase [Methanomicrobiales archaeon]
MGIEPIDDKARWDSFVQKSPYGQLFHHWDFLKIVERHTGFRFMPYAITKGEQIVGILPLFYRNTMGVRSVMSPPPKTGIPYLGLLLDATYADLKQYKREHILRIIAEDLRAEMDAYAPNLLSISSPPSLLDIRSFVWSGFSVEPLYTYVFDLRQGQERLWKGFSVRRRQQIRDAEKKGLEIAVSDDVSRLYGMVSERYSEQGLSSPFRSVDYLRDVCSAFPDNLKTFSVLDEGQVTSAVLVVQYRDVKLWVGGARSDNNSNEFLIWEVIKEAQRQGYESCEFIGANTQNLCQFKSQFNPSLELYFRISSKDIRGKLAETAYMKIIR